MSGWCCWCCAKLLLSEQSFAAGSWLAMWIWTRVAAQLAAVQPCARCQACSAGVCREAGTCSRFAGWHAAAAPSLQLLPPAVD